MQDSDSVISLFLSSQNTHSCRESSTVITTRFHNTLSRNHTKLPGSLTNSRHTCVKRIGRFERMAGANCLSVFLRVWRNNCWFEILFITSQTDILLQANRKGDMSYWYFRGYQFWLKYTDGKYTTIQINFEDWYLATTIPTTPAELIETDIVCFKAMDIPNYALIRVVFCSILLQRWRF